MWEVSVPITVQVSKHKRWSLNLNQYRNTHHQTLAKAKIKFAAIVHPLLIGIPYITKARISYILYPGTAAECDVANVCSIVDKFFSDVLVSAGKLPDDNYKFLVATAYGFGEIDRINPRVDVIIEALS